MTNEIAGVDEVCEILQPQFPQFRRIFQSALDKYLKTPPEVRLDHDRRTIGSCMHSHIVASFPSVFAGVRGAEIVDINGLNIVVIGKRFACHFKMVDRYGNASFHHTKQQEAFASDNLQLPGIERAPVAIRIGYLLDEAVTKIQHMLIVKPNGNRNEWRAMVSMDDVPSWTDVTEQRVFKWTDAA